MAKRFDQLSIKQRMTQRLQVMEDWANILGVGTIGNLLDTIAEGESEIARYLEYLYQEKKWRNARNMSSLTHMADLISYKRQLPKSAIGYVIISHTDINGVERLPNYGSTFFDLDQTSDFDNLIQNTEAIYTEKEALVPWTADDNYLIPEGTTFKSAMGANYISFQTVESRALKEPFSIIMADDAKKSDFIKAGGWNGIKYLKVPVIQGDIVNLLFGYAKGTRFESFTIDSIDVENASNIISEKFFKIKVTPLVYTGGIVSEENEEVWEKIENIRLAGPYDKVFEIKILNNEDKVLIKFGDGITGQTLPVGARIACNYLETKGVAGNIDKRFQIVKMTLPQGYQMIDPRTNQASAFLQCTNIVPIMGGKDIEQEEELRLNAPPSYLQSYSTATKSTYYEQIIKNSPINLLHCRIFQSGIYDLESYGKDISSEKYLSTIESGVLQEIHSMRNSLLITAIRSNGTKIDDPYNELIEPLIKIFEDKSSPNDSFDYIEPNYIEIRPNITINTTESITEQNIINAVIPEVLAKYSIFNTNFEKPYFKSDLIDIAQNFGFTKHSECFLEAKTQAKMKPIILSDRAADRDIILNKDTLLAFPFNFDRIFAQNKLNPGFRNYKDKASYVVRCDLIFKDPIKSRSLFLYDNRTCLHNEISLYDGELEPINEEIQIPYNLEHNYINFQGVINFQDSYSELFSNQQVRTAQFKYIDKITSDSYMYKMKRFDIEPYEIRPLLIDTVGKNKIFDINEVPESQRMSFNLDDNIIGQQCYWQNDLFYPNCKILFDEHYYDNMASNYARGHIIIPLNKVFEYSDRQNLFNMLVNVTELDKMAEFVEKLLKDHLTINIYAQPVMDVLNCDYPFDIIFSNRDNILVQKNYITSK